MRICSSLNASAFVSAAVRPIVDSFLFWFFTAILLLCEYRPKMEAAGKFCCPGFFEGTPDREYVQGGFKTAFLFGLPLIL
jgi:hypothetical protein